MAVLLTGATGFIGKKILAELLKRYSCDNIIALASQQLSVKTILHNNYDFSIDEDTANEIDILIHAGAYIPKQTCDVNLVNNNTSNIIVSQRILEQCGNLKKIIFISTVDIYKADGIITEDSAVAPSSLYGWSKLYCEKMIEAFAKQRNIDCQILRVGHVFGEGEEKYIKILPVTISKVLRDEVVEIWGDGKAVRTFIYVDDVARAVVNAIDVTGLNTVNVVGDKGITINELVRDIIDISGKNIKINFVHPETVNRNLLFENSKLKELLLPQLTSMKDGLQKEYLYMRQLFYENLL